MNETFFVGKVDKASEDLVRNTYECLEKAIALGLLPNLVQYVVIVSFICFAKITAFIGAALS